MSSKGYIAIVNGAAGGGRCRERAQAALDELRSRGVEVDEVRFTERAGHASEMASELAKEGAPRILAVGGDGTAFEVVNGLSLGQDVSTSFTLDSEAMAAEIPPTQQPEATPPANQQTGTSQEAAKPAVTSPTTNAQSQEGAPKQNGTTAQATTPKASSTPAPESGITFKVQITAAHREVGQAYFIQRHRYDGPFSIEHNDGWIKYVTGMFDRYRSARDQRQAYLDANYNFPGPFVTAYNNGERITVQEALMIAKQSSVQ